MRDFRMAVMSKYINGEFLLWLMIFALILRGMTVCSARPLLDSARATTAKSHPEEIASVERVLQFDPQSNDANFVHKGLAKFLFTMLPKGPVAPSGPSPIHNEVPTDSVAGKP